jgi:hypothetical protein
MDKLSAFGAMLTGGLSFCAFMLLKTYFFGERSGDLRSDVRNLKEENAKLRKLCSRMKSVLEIHITKEPIDEGD